MAERNNNATLKTWFTQIKELYHLLSPKCFQTFYFCLTRSCFEQCCSKVSSLLCLNRLRLSKWLLWVIYDCLAFGSTVPLNKLINAMSAEIVCFICNPLRIQNFDWSTSTSAAWDERSHSYNSMPLTLHWISFSFTANHLLCLNML